MTSEWNDLIIKLLIIAGSVYLDVMKINIIVQILKFRIPGPPLYIILSQMLGA